MSTPTIDREVEIRLGEGGIRYTRGRRLVVAAMAQSPGPRSATDLHAEIGEAVPMSSLYRTLVVLEDADVVEPHFSAGGVARYELAEWITGHHHHLICVECGSIEDIELPKQYERRIHILVEQIGDLAAFAPTNHALEIEGHCQVCR